jgi:hypothetical protein
VAPLLTPHVAVCTSRLTPLVAAYTSLVTPLHANGLGLGIGHRQYSSGCCEGEGSNFSEKRKSLSTGDRFRLDNFTHGQNSQGSGERLCVCSSKVPVLI